MFEPCHLVECGTLFADAFRAEPWNQRWTKVAARQFLRSIANAPGFLGVVMLNTDNQVIAFAMGDLMRLPDGVTFELEELCVTPNMQGIGYGTQLWMHLEKELRKLGVTNVVLDTLKDSLPERFYLRNGFRRSNRLMHMNKQI